MGKSPERNPGKIVRRYQRKKSRKFSEFVLPIFVLQFPERVGARNFMKNPRHISRATGQNSSTARLWDCNGRALDRVIKQKHRQNRQKLFKKCPKIVFSPPLDNFWTFFRHSLFLAVQRFARYNSGSCGAQHKKSLWN